VPGLAALRRPTGRGAGPSSDRWPRHALQRRRVVRRPPRPGHRRNLPRRCGPTGVSFTAALTIRSDIPSRNSLVHYIKVRRFSQNIDLILLMGTVAIRATSTDYLCYFDNNTHTMSDSDESLFGLSEDTLRAATGPPLRRKWKNLLKQSVRAKERLELKTTRRRIHQPRSTLVLRPSRLLSSREASFTAMKWTYEGREYLRIHWGSNLNTIAERIEEDLRRSLKN